MKMEPIVGAGVGFFSLLIGLGLTHLLEEPTLQDIRWPCFVIGVAIFFRYISGSAGHLWFEHIRRDDTKTFRFLKDLAVLFTFGVIAVVACFQKTLREFLWWMICLSAAAFVWGLLDFFVLNRGSLRTRVKRSRWWPWMIINIVQISLIYLVIPSQGSTKPSFVILGVEVDNLWLLATLMLLLLAVDLWLQLEYMLQCPLNPSGSRSVDTD